MAGLLGYAAAGALSGLGQGMVEDGKAKREMALRMLEEQSRMNYLRESDRLAGEREAARDERTAKRQEEQDQRRFDRETARDNARLERETGLLTQIIQDEQGNYIGVTRGGQQIPLNVKGRLPKSATGSDRLVQVYDPDTDSIKYVPESEAAGMEPAGTASDREARREREDMERADARKQAEQEASERAGYLSTDATDFKDDGGSRSAFIERRTNEILASRKGKTVQQPTDSADKPQKTDGAPKGSGTRADPYKASTQADIDWFKNNAPAGTVIEVNGKLYTK